MKIISSFKYSFRLFVCRCDFLNSSRYFTYVHFVIVIIRDSIYIYIYIYIYSIYIYIYIYIYIVSK